ncbi:hypothetical protein [Serratia sp. 14-2641]|uniref:hypothetical protein n=1 Tax=Serratia sp. 14-2641 TaxID=1841657 RepID=UPI00080FC540|nr:hypothetical protein [Serratia sp. 14-2641]OCJ20015.1 hypothetical protein A6U95_15235 [Serratia sp. 14-2641]
MFYVFSTLSTDVDYTIYGEAVNDMPTIERQITIKGGANVATKNLITPKGVMTTVEDADLELLRAHPVFIMHEKNGFVTVEQKAHDPEKVATNMEARDNSAPLTDGDFAEGEAPAGSKGAKKK